MTHARLKPLHRQAIDLLRDGLCAEHIHREIAQIAASLKALQAPTPTQPQGD